MYDITIIGAGPAGMTAAVYAARKQLDTLIITENVGGQTLLSSNVDNYLGYHYINGEDLVKKFEEHLGHFPVEMKYERVVSFLKEDGALSVHTGKSNRYETRTVIVASGKSPRRLGVPGEDMFAARGITYCATCDAPLFAGKDVVVVGGGNSGADAVIQLAKMSPRVYLIESSTMLHADEVLRQQIMRASNVEVLTQTEIAEIKGSTLLESVVIRNKQTEETRELPVSGVFVEIGLVPNSSFVPQQVERNKWDEILVDKACRTNIRGVFAAGDVTNVHEKQIIIAAGEGAKAALSAYDLLIGKTIPKEES